MKVITIQDVKINLNKWGRILFFLTFFIQLSHASPLKVAILDTGFCPSLLMLKKNIKVNSQVDLTHSVKLNCKSYSISNRRFHGQWVLEQFLKNLKTTKEVEITPFIIFDKNGIQKEIYWQRAFSKQAEFHLIISAAGLLFKNKIDITETIKTPIFVAGATLGKRIKKNSKIWPQIEFRKDLVFTIGSYLPKSEALGSREDYTLLRPKEMKYFFSSGDSIDHFKGSSRAVATASARALDLCYEKLIGFKGLKSCLKKKQFQIKLDESKTRLLSF